MKTFLIQLVILTLAQLIITPTYAGEQGFFNHSNQYRGFYWFETKAQEEDKASKEYVIPTPEEAEQLIAARKKRLDDARSQMIAVGLDPEAPMEAKRKAIIEYKKLDVAMWGGAVDMAKATLMGNFTNPEIANLAERPTSVAAIKLKKKLDARMYSFRGQSQSVSRHLDAICNTATSIKADLCFVQSRKKDLEPNKYSSSSSGS